MRKSAVYSWRLDPNLKTALEEEARREDVTVSEILDRVLADWIGARRAERGDDPAEEQRLRASARKTFGSIRGGDPKRSARVRDGVRERLERRRAR